MFRVAALILFLQLTTLAHAGDNDLEKQIKAMFKTGQLKGLHSVLVTHKGKPIAEVYFEGKDERWGRKIGKVKHGVNTLHDLRSVTKSVVSLLYGIALSEGLVPDVEQSVISQFPEYKDLAKDPKRRKIKIKHVLTMRMGTYWNENLPYTDRRNSEIAMEYAKDRYRFVLEQKIIEEPGKTWGYSGGATTILARIIAKGTGKPLDIYAKEKLFTPLGITNFEWVKGRDGEPSAASGLRLTLRGLVKIGQMISHKGLYNNKQIVPSDWLKASFTPRLKLQSGLKYGFHWYLAPQGQPPIWLAGFGNGGQRVSVQPNRDLVFGFFAGNYNKPNAWKIPVKVMTDILIPELRSRFKKKK